MPSCKGFIVENKISPARWPPGSGCQIPANFIINSKLFSSNLLERYTTAPHILKKNDFIGTLCANIMAWLDNKLEQYLAFPDTDTDTIIQ